MTTAAIVKGQAGPLPLLLTWGATVSVAVGAIYFANGLTAPTGVARVSVEPGAATGNELTSGWLSDVSTTATFHYLEIDSSVDRLSTRLELVSIWGTLALALWALALLAARWRGAESAQTGTARAPWLALAAVAASAGLLVPVATWVQSQTVLTAAGQPAGLEPIAHVGWPWLATALLCVAIARRVDQLRTG